MSMRLLRPGRLAVLVVLIILVVMLTLSMYQRRTEAGPPPAPEPGRNDIVRQLVEMSNAFNSATEIALVMAATRAEDLRWLLDYCRDRNAVPLVYSTDSNPDPGFQIPRTTRGRETAAYLSYVVDFYDRLPAYSFFVHSNPDQWHNDLFGPMTKDTLPHVRLEAIDAQGYVNLRCTHDPGCPTSVNPWDPTQIDIEKDDIRAFFPQVYESLFDVGPDQVPEHIGNVCCGQFAVSRERIRQRPRADYERMLRWAAETELTDSFGVGWVFEKIWHIVFGTEVIYCPRFEQCRCDVYGWCGPLTSGETLQAVRAKPV